MRHKERTKKIAGILGGMGPEATVDLLGRIVKKTRAQDDRDHVHCIVEQNPHVPSRIKNLLEGGSISPGPSLVAMARNLEAAGADFLCIACNTAHNWYGDVAASVNIPVLNIITIASRKAAAVLQEQGAGLKKVGILASPAVRLTHLYEQPCNELDLEPVYADEEYENMLLDIIKAVKSGKTDAEISGKFHEVIRHMEQKGASALIIACTELGVLPYATTLPVIDAADTLASEIITNAGCELKD